MSESLTELQDLLAREKDALAGNLAELEQKVRDTTDWRLQVERRPLPAVALVAAGGMILGMLGGSRRPQRRPTEETAEPATPSPVVEHLQDAAVSIAAGLMVGLLRDFLANDPSTKEPATPAE
jgi:hypothetical protein